MYTISFRIPLGVIHGTRNFLNGSCQTATPRNKGDIIHVGLTGRTTEACVAEVIDSRLTGKVRGYKWELC